MKKILFVLIPFILLIGIVGIQDVDGVCMTDLDWPHALCPSDVASVPGPSTEDYKKNMQQYFEYKGAEWMMMKKTEMDNAIKNDILFEWINYDKEPDGMGRNYPNTNVWRYYHLHEDAPDIEWGKKFKRPHKQIELGILPSHVACKGTLILKNSDNSPACVSTLTYQKLAERGWGDKPFQDYFFETEGIEYHIRYKINDGSLTIYGMLLKPENNTLFLTGNFYHGNITIELPRSLIDSTSHHDKNNDEQYDMPFSVFITERKYASEGSSGFNVFNEIEVDYKELKTTSMNRTLSIPFTKDTEQIEIVGFK